MNCEGSLTYTVTTTPSMIQSAISVNDIDRYLEFGTNLFSDIGVYSVTLTAIDSSSISLGTAYFVWTVTANCTNCQIAYVLP